MTKEPRSSRISNMLLCSVRAVILTPESALALPFFLRHTWQGECHLHKAMATTAPAQLGSGTGGALKTASDEGSGPSC